MNGPVVNGTARGPAVPGLMGPPSRPPERPVEERQFDDILAGTGINIEEEERSLTSQDYYNRSTPTTSFQSQYPSFGTASSGSQDRSGSSARTEGERGYGVNGEVAAAPPLSAEELQDRENARADWEAARQIQHPLKDMFLFGESLLQRMKDRCAEGHTDLPQAGVYIAQPNMPPQRMRVNGLDGASQIIDRGQTILKTGESEAIGAVFKTVCLAARARLTGLAEQSKTLARSRLDHSSGKVPDEWVAVAAVPTSRPGSSGNVASPAAPPSLKREFSRLGPGFVDRSHASGPLSQPNGDAASLRDTRAATPPISSTIQDRLRRGRTAEDARSAKRARRSASANPESGQTPLQPVAGTDAAPVATPDTTRQTKKEKKLAETRFTEQQQHKSANETARMATTGLLGGRFGGKAKKSYSWLSGGAPTASPVGTPGRLPSISAASAPAPATLGSARAPVADKGKVFGQWDEAKESGIQTRDVLLALEIDGNAGRSFLKGYSTMDG